MAEEEDKEGGGIVETHLLVVERETEGDAAEEHAVLDDESDRKDGYSSA